MAESTIKSNKIGLAAGGLGAVMLAAAQTKPEDAISNLAGWLDLLGFNGVPSFLATPQADAWASGIGITLIVLSGLTVYWRRKKRRAAAFIEDTAASQLSGRWQPLHKALHHLAYESEWASRQLTPTSRDEFDRIVGDEFKEQLARGEIAARGKAGLTNAAHVPRTTQPIPTDYWVTAFIQPYGEIVLADDARGATVRPNENGFVGVVVDWADVQRIWPRRAPSNSLTPLATLCEPERRQIELEKQRQKEWQASPLLAVGSELLTAQAPPKPRRDGLAEVRQERREKKQELNRKRREQIAALRAVAVEYGAGSDGGFRGRLERELTYAEIRQHLSPEFVTDLHRQRHGWARPDGAHYGYLVQSFLNELDRLEREWKLI